MGASRASEIAGVLGGVAGAPVTVSFVPHLLPVTRGIYTTVHADLKEPVAEAFVRSMLGAHDAGAVALATQVSPRWTPPEQAGGAVWDSAAFLNIYL